MAEVVLVEVRLVLVEILTVVEVALVLVASILLVAESEPRSVILVFLSARHVPPLVSVLEVICSWLTVCIVEAFSVVSCA